MKKLKPNQLGPWCSYCPSKSVRATHKISGCRIQHCCDLHISNLLKLEQDTAKLDSHMSEADYQTWGSL